MFDKNDYLKRGYNFIHNQISPYHKRVSSLMIYATDLCDSGCKHCLIWAKRPTSYLPFESIVKIMQSKCINSSTIVGLEGGEFLLHPDADKILNWFALNHPNFDVYSNCLKPDKLISSVEKYKPHRLYISLDGDQETYLYMRGKDGYDSVLRVIDALKNKVPIFVMFTLSPYNDMKDLEHVALVCKEKGVFLRVGIYNNIPFFDTIDDAKSADFGELKNKEALNYKKVKEIRNRMKSEGEQRPIENHDQKKNQPIPVLVKEFKENYDYLYLYHNWSEKKLKLKCYSILDSVVVLPDGSVPICQNLDIKLGNIYQSGLDEIFNSPESVKAQKHYSENCNQCWISYHRKYDIALFRTFEKYFGRWATSKFLGYYTWDEDNRQEYKDVVR